jgi:hypothetical protein
MLAHAVPTAIGHLVPPPEHLSVALPRDPDLCFELFCDIDRIPEWLAVVRTAQATMRDPEGRAREVAFLGRLEHATIGYSCRYRYGTRRVQWSTSPGATLRVEGYAAFSPLGDKACLMTYALETHFGSLPPWADPTYASHPASASLGDFRDFVLRTL